MKLLSTLLILGASILSAEEASPKVTPIPPELTKLLDATSLKYDQASDGTPGIILACSDGSKQLVYILKEPLKYGNYSMRQVVCCVYQGATKPPDSVLSDALVLSWEMKSGRFQLNQISNGTEWVLYVVGLFPDSGDAATLKQLIEGVAITAADFKTKNKISYINEAIAAEENRKAKSSEFNTEKVESKEAKDTKARDEKLRTAFNLFPKVEVGENSPINFELSKDSVKVDGKRFYGFRFIAMNSTARHHFALSFMHQGGEFEGPSRWYIIRKNGLMEGFSDCNLKLGKVSGQADYTTIFQAVNSAKFIKGEEYLVWFEFESDKHGRIDIYCDFCDFPTTANNKYILQDLAGKLKVPEQIKYDWIEPFSKAKDEGKVDLPK